MHFTLILSGRERSVEVGRNVKQDCESIRYNVGEGSTLRLWLNGINTTYYKLDEQPGYIRWGADVSGLAGALTELAFSLTATGSWVGFPTPDVIIGLDSISFSPSIIPEPSSFGLLALGTGALMISRRRKQRVVQ